MAKTLGDYLLDGGIGGKIFKDDDPLSEEYCRNYEVRAIDTQGVESSLCLQVVYFRRGSKNREPLSFIDAGPHIDDLEVRLRSKNKKETYAGGCRV